MGSAEPGSTLFAAEGKVQRVNKFWLEVHILQAERACKWRLCVRCKTIVERSDFCMTKGKLPPTFAKTEMYGFRAEALQYRNQPER